MRAAVMGSVLIVAVVALGSGTVCANPFVNFDFEQATVVPTGPQFVQASPAFPGWTARIGSSVISAVAYNYHGIGEAEVALYDQPDGPFNIPLLQGSYMAVMINSTTPAFTASLEQTGDVPADARSLHFLTSRTRPPPRVTLDGATLPLFQMSSDVVTEKAEWAADVGGFGGVTALLRFSTSPTLPYGYSFGLDDIRFSTEFAPEPNALALGAVCGFLMLRRKRTV
ncbi:MAG: hypothetical protein ACREJC_18375 [Tepidisphaeraceae bacterium]